MGREANILIPLYDNPGRSGRRELARDHPGTLVEVSNAAGATYSDGELTQILHSARLSPGLCAFSGRHTAILPILRGRAGAVL